MHTQNAPYRYNDKTAPPGPPDILFDGTRLGLEATLISALGVAIPVGILAGLSTSLGYLERYAEGMPVEARAFSPAGFIFASLLAFFVLTIAMFFGSAIPTMLYNMGLVAYMLRWLRKRRGRDKLASTIAGGILGLFSGIPCTALGMIIAEMPPHGALYARLWSWPALLSVDGLFLLWMTLIPPINVIGGLRSGWKIGERIEEVKLYWFWQ